MSHKVINLFPNCTKAVDYIFSERYEIADLPPVVFWSATHVQGHRQFGRLGNMREETIDGQLLSVFDSSRSACS
ncbi:hypothetical protein BDK88_4148 [Natrinema hispanicum]|uniref:Uncharacterized protein n=1 Tax=Natrinema hispanicum TaxID=392421 RepID=A0A482Y7L7_9EURY|nr:hypothetical protein BDK88_4148 [Natrinema hispanicum]